MDCVPSACIKEEFSYLPNNLQSPSPNRKTRADRPASVAPREEEKKPLSSRAINACQKLNPKTYLPMPRAKIIKHLVSSTQPSDTSPNYQLLFLSPLLDMVALSILPPPFALPHSLSLSPFPCLITQRPSTSQATTSPPNPENPTLRIESS